MTLTVSKQSKSLIIFAPNSAACLEVPQPVKSMLLIVFIDCGSEGEREGSGGRVVEGGRKSEVGDVREGEREGW